MLKKVHQSFYQKLKKRLNFHQAVYLIKDICLILLNVVKHLTVRDDNYDYMQSAGLTWIKLCK